MEVIEKKPPALFENQTHTAANLFTTAAVIKGILRGQLEIAQKIEQNQNKLDNMVKFLSLMSAAELRLNPAELGLTRGQAKERIKKIKESDPDRITPESIQISIDSSALITSTAQFERQFLPLGKRLEATDTAAPAFRLSYDANLSIQERQLEVTELDPITLEPMN